MSPTRFFVVTAVIELGAGLAFLMTPALVISLLVGPSNQTVSRHRAAGWRGPAVAGLGVLVDTP